MCNTPQKITQLKKLHTGRNYTPQEITYFSKNYTLLEITHQKKKTKKLQFSPQMCNFGPKACNTPPFSLEKLPTSRSYTQERNIKPVTL